MEVATTKQPTPKQEGVSSFAKSLFLGEIHEDLVFPFPKPDAEEQEKTRVLIERLREIADELIDVRKAEDERWIGDDVIAALGEAGLCGLYVPEEYGGQGLSQTGYCRVSEVFAQIDPTLSVVMGVHQSIGMKPIALFGSEEQKGRFLPELASGSKLAAFALTEAAAGSDVNGIETTASRQSDGSWLLNGVKRYIGNGSKAAYLSTFARIEDSDEFICLIVESDMEGFQPGHRYDTMGLRANDLRQLHFDGVRVPAANVIGEPGDGFKIAMHTLNNGRMSLGTGSVGGTKLLLDKVIEHVKERKQFGMSLSEFELVQDKIGWMVSYLFGLESMAYMTTGLVDADIPDYSLESAIVKVSSTEFLWYAANRALQLKGGAGYMRDEPYEKTLRDTRVFPIFEGANDVMRAFIALSGMKPVGEKLGELADLDWTSPIGSIGVLFDYVGDRIQREVRPDRITRAHEVLKPVADDVAEQVKQLRDESEKLLRRHRNAIMERQFQQKRLADATADIYAQIAVISRVSAIFDEHGVEPSGQEKYIAQTFCERAARRVRQNFDQLERNDDDRMVAIAKLALKRGEYGYAFFED